MPRYEIEVHSHGIPVYRLGTNGHRKRCIGNALYTSGVASIIERDIDTLEQLQRQQQNSADIAARLQVLRATDSRLDTAFRMVESHHYRESSQARETSMYQEALDVIADRRRSVAADLTPDAEQ